MSPEPLTTSATRVAVMGAGSWGTAFSMVLADAGCSVALWSHHADQAEAINRERVNSAFFPDLGLPDSITAFADAAEAMDEARFVVLAIPSQALRENLARWSIP